LGDVCLLAKKMKMKIKKRERYWMIPGILPGNNNNNNKRNLGGSYEAIFNLSKNMATNN
jgi:hypothetical protein